MEAWLDRVHQGDCLELLRELPSASVHCCVTSPPYWGLRDYGVDGQLGLEPTPKEYVARMVEVFGEVRRVLRDDGTLWLNVGDSFCSGGREGHGTRIGYKQQTNRGMNGSADPARAPQPPGLKPKDLVGIPWRLAFALQADGWYLRSDIIWAKPNPMPESVRDRPTKSHEYVFLLSKSGRYYWDQEAVREPCSSGPSDVRKMMQQLPRIGGKHKALDDKFSAASAQTHIGRTRAVGDPSGRNTRDVWTIATQPCPSAHFAVMPSKLVEPCVKAGTSERGCCPECGAPWERVVERTSTGRSYATGKSDDKRSKGLATAFSGYDDGSSAPTFTTIGWRPTCTCDAGEPEPCTVLDPFMGAGTVGMVATSLGRHYIGIELNPEYIAIAEDRIDTARRKLSEHLPLEVAPR